MIVRELIDILQNADPESEVFVFCGPLQEKLSVSDVDIETEKVTIY